MLPSEELLQSIDIIAQNAAKNGVKIYTAIVTAVGDNNTCSVRVNGKTHSNIAYYGDAPTVNKSYRVFCPNGSMNQAFIITGGGSSGGGGTGTTDYNQLTNRPSINGTTLSGNQTSSQLGLYGTNNTPPYPVTSVNGQTGNVVIPTGGNVDSVNGKTGVVELNAADVGALPNTTVIPDKTSQLDNDSGYITNSALTGYAKKTEIPTKTSELTNDSGYITNTALEPYAKTVDIPTKTSQLNNDSGYITANDVPVKSVDGATGDVVTNAVKTTTQTLTDAQKQQARTNIGAGTSSFDGDYNSLTNKPTIPTKTSQLTNDSGFITDAALTGYAKTTDIPTKTSQLDNDSHYITANEAPVTSVNSKTGAVQLNASDVGALPDTTVIPSKTSQLDNDSGFITDIPIASATQLGGIKVGAGLSVTENGVLSATGGGTADAVEWNNVLDKPTTIAGYGITDAKIENGTITLGNQTITPLTSSPVTSVNSKTGAVVLGASDVGALPADTVIPTVNDATLTIRRNSVDIGSFTSNSANDVNIDINVPTDKSDIGLGNVDNVKQYSVTNPPPYPVTSVNGQIGDVTISAELPEHLVKYDTLAPIETTTPINADTLQGYAANYFATEADVSALSAVVDSNIDDITTNTQNISTLQSNISTLQSSVNGKVSKSGDTMTGALVAQNNTNYSVAQVRNIIVSTSDPSGGNSGDIWIKYVE